MRLSVCIVSWNTCGYLRECLTSLLAYPPAGDEIEVIVVDNASSDGSAEMAAGEFPSVILLAETTNLGYAEGNNLALERATGDALLLLNPDVVVYPDVPHARRIATAVRRGLFRDSGELRVTATTSTYDSARW